MAVVVNLTLTLITIRFYVSIGVKTNVMTGATFTIPALARTLPVRALQDVLFCHSLICPA